MKSIPILMLVFLLSAVQRFGQGADSDENNVMEAQLNKYKVI